MKKRIYVEAVRTIQPGEELAYDYQIERDPEDPPNVDEIFACRCGAAKCRGSMLVAAKKPRNKPRKKPVKKSTLQAAKKRAGKALKKKVRPSPRGSSPGRASSRRAAPRRAATPRKASRGRQRLVAATRAGRSAKRRSAAR